MRAWETKQKMSASAKTIKPAFLFFVFWASGLNRGAKTGVAGEKTPPLPARLGKRASCTKSEQLDSGFYRLCSASVGEGVDIPNDVTLQGNLVYTTLFPNSLYRRQGYSAQYVTYEPIRSGSACTAEDFASSVHHDVYSVEHNVFIGVVEECYEPPDNSAPHVRIHADIHELWDASFDALPSTDEPAQSSIKKYPILATVAEEEDANFEDAILICTSSIGLVLKPLDEQTMCNSTVEHLSLIHI